MISLISKIKKFKFNFYNSLIKIKLKFEKMAGLDSRKDYFSIVNNIFLIKSNYIGEHFRYNRI